MSDNQNLRSGDCVGIDVLAKLMHCSTRDIHNRIYTGRIPGDYIVRSSLVRKVFIKKSYLEQIRYAFPSVDRYLDNSTKNEN
jgi:hypothetical protein